MSQHPSEPSSRETDLPIQDADLLLQSYDYDLPPERIAQNPVTPRDQSRLLVLKDRDYHAHHTFRDLTELLRAGDRLVFNNTQVIPARLYGSKPEGAKVEVLLLEERQRNEWLVLVKPGKRLKPGATIVFDRQDGSDKPGELSAIVLETDEATGGRVLQFEVSGGKSLLEVLSAYGEVPLPPYVTETQAAPDQYQTVYAERPGAVAAPTAGLHFTPELLTRLQEKGIGLSFLTLHVGVGTFRPVEAENIKAHQMHGEWVEISPDTVEEIRQTRSQGGRVIAVGTTVVRSLEAAAQGGHLEPFCGKTNLFIYPGYRWRVVEGLITNFHLPKSSLLMLVSALIGRQRLLSLYREAIDQQYRFYSFGDAMLILPEARIN